MQRQIWASLRFGKQTERFLRSWPAEYSGSLITDKGKVPPWDETLTRLMHDPRVNVHLTAMPHIPQAVQNPQLKETKRERESAGNGPKGQPTKKQRFNDPEPAKIPDELKGLKFRTAKVKPTCWHFNLSKGCNNQIKMDSASSVPTHV